MNVSTEVKNSPVMAIAATIETLTAMQSPTAQQNRSMAIFDPGVEDWESLVAGVVPGIEVVVLHPDRDGVTQITELLANRSQIQALHIISHGEPGCLYLGSSRLATDTLNSYSPLLQQWRNALTPDADILIYGCNVAKAPSTHRSALSHEQFSVSPTSPTPFLHRLHELTHANIAASANLTGDAAKGGDWALEVRIGKVKTALAFAPETMAGYKKTLAQARDVEWIKQFGTTAGDDIREITADSDGNLYVVGKTNGNLDGTNAGDSDAWIAKHDKNGNQQWVKQFGTASSDTSEDIVVDSAGNFYVVGQTGGNLGGTNAGKIDSWVAKYDLNGNQQWLRQFGTASNDESQGMIIDSAGNIYLTGVTTGSLEGINAGGRDAWIAKYDNNGNQQWVRQFGTSNDDESTNVTVDSAGNIYLTGDTTGDLAGSAGNRDAWIAKYDSNGNQQWVRQFGQINNDDSTYIAVDSNDNLYIAGHTNNNLYGVNAGLHDVLIAKYDNNGNQQWIRQFGSDQNDYAGGLAIDSHNKIYISGKTDGDVGNTNAGVSDILVASYDSAGNQQWVQQFGTASADASWGVTVDSTSNLYVSGWTDGVLGNTNAGNRDGWIAKLSPIVSISPGTTPNETDATIGTFTLTRSEPAPIGGVTVNYTVAGTATDGTDYTSLSGTAVIPAGSTTTTIDLAPIDDGVYEPDETVEITLTPGTDYALDPANSTASHTLHSIGVSIAAGTAASETGPTSGTFNLTLTEPAPTGGMTVNYTVAGTASNGSDYTALPGSIVIPAGDTTATINIAPTDDSLDEADETVELTLVAGTDYDLVSGSETASLTLTDNDTAGLIIAETGSNTAASEDGTTDTYAIKLATEPTGTVEIAVTPDAQTDLGNGAATPVPLTFDSSNWDAEQTVTVSAIDDPDVEYDHTGTITHSVTSTDANYNGLTVTDVTVSLTDNDWPTVSIAAGTPPEETSATPGNFEITLSDPAPPGGITLNYSVAGTATSGSDYTALSGTLFIAEGDTSASIQVVPTEDAIADPGETVEVTLDTGTNYNVNAASNTASVTLTDNDTAGVTVSTISGDTNEAGGSASFEVVLDTEPTADVTVNLVSSNTGEGDVSVPSLTFTPSNWNIPQTVTVTGADDAVADGNTTYSIQTSITSTDSIYNSLNPNDVSITNIDDDTANIIVTQTGGSTAITEGSLTDTYQFVLTSAPTAEVNITVTPDAQTDLGNGAETAVTLTFNDTNWNTAQTVTVTATDDTAVEYAHTSTITHTVTSTDTNYNGMAVGNITANVTDNDLPQVTVAAGNNASEANTSSGQFTLTLSDGAPAGGLTVNYTVAGTATSDTDYTALPGNVFIPAGATTANINVTPLEDAIDEPDETVKLTVATGTGYELGTTSEATISVIDNDTAGAKLTQSNNSTNLAESGTTDTYEIVLLSQPTQDVNITVNPDSQTQVVGASTLTFAPSNWNVPQTITVSAIDDTAVEYPHSGTISHSITSSDAIYNGMSLSAVTANIADNDWPTLGIAPGTSPQEQSATTGNFLLTLSDPAPSEGIRVSYSFRSNASTGTDYNPLSGSAFIPAGATSANINIVPIDDFVDEDDESIEVSLNPGTNHNIGSSGTATTYVIDNDTAGMRIVESGSGTDVSEGVWNDTYTVVLSSQPTADVRINFTTDATLNSIAPLTFTSSNWNVPQTVTVSADDNERLENDRTVAIAHTVSSTDPKYDGMTLPNINAYVRDPSFYAWQNLEAYLNRVYQSNPLLPTVKDTLKSTFATFERGKTSSATTPIAKGDFDANQIELVPVDSSQTDLISLLTSLPKSVSSSYRNNFSKFISLLSGLQVSVPMPPPPLTVTNLHSDPIYEWSGKLQVPNQGSVFGLIKNNLGINELTLKARVNTANSGAVDLEASLDGNKTLFNFKGFRLAYAGADFTAGVDWSKEPTLKITPKLQLTNYDPFQSNEPPLKLFGSFTFEPTSISGGFKVEPDNLYGSNPVWKNPFGLSNSELRNMSIELKGDTNSLLQGVISGDFRYKNFDMTTGLMVNLLTGFPEGLILTANRPVNLIDIFALQSSLISRKSRFIQKLKPVQNGLNLLKKIIDIDIKSIDSNKDGRLDPLIKFAPETITIAGQNISRGFAINGEVNAWGKRASLFLEADPFSNRLNLRGSLTVPNIDLGFLRLKGYANDADRNASTLNLNFDFKGNSVSLAAGTQLELFGKTIAGVNAAIDGTSIKFKDLNLNFGPVLKVDLDNLNVNLSKFNGSASGGITLFGIDLQIPRFSMNNSQLSFSGGLGINVLKTRFDVNVDIDLGKHDSEIEIHVSGFGKKIKLIDGNLDWFTEKFRQVDNLKSFIQDAFWDFLKPTKIVDTLISTVEGVVEKAIDFGKKTVDKVGDVVSIFGIKAGGYINGADIFFDANFNGLQDEGESSTLTLPDGSFRLRIDLGTFDLNQNGKLDPNEGRIMGIGGQDTSTNLPNDTPMMALPGSTVVTPLTTIVAGLVQQGVDPEEAQTQLKAALGLPSSLDLNTYDHLEAMGKGDANGLAVYSFDIQILKTIAQTAKFLSGVSEMSLVELSEAAIASFSNQIQDGTLLDLGNIETIQAIFQDAILKAAEKDPSINPSQLSATATAAVQIVALSNQTVKDLAASSGSIEDISLEITKLQAVSMGQVAVGMPKLAAGTLSVEEFLANNTKESILSRMETVEVNDPSFRPVVEREFSETEGNSSLPPLLVEGLPSSSDSESSNSESSNSGEDSANDTNNAVNLSHLFFDAEYYLAQNTDVAAALQNGTFRNAAQHFSAFGFAEGRAPSEMFAQDYLAQNTDVADAVANDMFASGFEHFINFGFAEGRFPSDVFKDLEMFYVSQHADAAEAVANETHANGLEHLVTVGFAEGRNPFPQFEVLTQTFNAQDYLSQNADVADAVESGTFRSAMEHFVRFGMFEGRNPGLAFSNSDYLVNNRDVESAVSEGGFASGYEHYLMHGFAEGRIGGAIAVNPGMNFNLGDRSLLTEEETDLLTGENALNADMGEVDQLIGQPGAETFTLGDANEVYYLNSADADSGKEYAILTDFNASEDSIQLQGAPADYHLAASPTGMPTGTAIYRNEGDSEDLIAVVQDVSDLSLQSDYFSFV